MKYSSKRIPLTLLIILSIFLVQSSSFADCISGNCKDGQGTYSFQNGDHYVGQYKNGKRNGQGTYTFPSGEKYVGQFKNGKFNGQGATTFPNKQKYVGQYEDGKRAGQGTYSFPSGEKYVGQFKNDKYNGLGTTTFPDGNKHTGLYKDGKRDGHGTYTYPDGEKYVGQFQNGKYNGQGTTTFANGNKHTGLYKDGKRNGHGVYMWTKGNKYVGEFKGKMNGQGTFTWSNGNRYVGEFKDDKKIGQCALYLVNGSEFFGECSQDKKNVNLTFHDGNVLKFDIQTAKVTQFPKNISSNKTKIAATKPVINQSKTKKLALVIGNANYQHSPLSNPVNDAMDMSKSLQTLGFEVITKVNVNGKEMTSGINSFFNKSKTSDVNLVYYAGHGMQVDGENFLIPLGADIQAATDIKYEAYPAGKIVERLGRKQGAVNIVILDACRNNPFRSYFRSNDQGLARMSAPTGTILIYATGPGSVAADGKGRNGVFTEHFLKHIREPGQDVQDIMMKVRKGVIADTGGKQVPWESSSLTDHLYFIQQ